MGHGRKRTKDKNKIAEQNDESFIGKNDLSYEALFKERRERNFFISEALISKLFHHMEYFFDPISCGYIQGRGNGSRQRSERQGTYQVRRQNFLRL